MDEFFGEGGLDSFLTKSGDWVRDAEPSEVTAGLSLKVIPVFTPPRETVFQADSAVVPVSYS